MSITNTAGVLSTLALFFVVECQLKVEAGPQLHPLRTYRTKLFVADRLVKGQ